MSRHNVTLPGMSDFAVARNEARLRTVEGRPSYVWTDARGVHRVGSFDVRIPDDAEGIDPITYQEAIAAYEKSDSRRAS